MPDSPGGTRHHANDGTLRIQKPALHLRKGFFMGKYHDLYIGYFLLPVDINYMVQDCAIPEPICNVLNS